MKITSVNNDLVKDTSKLLQTKYRQETGLFLLEGEKCIQEALTYGLEIQKIFVLEGYKIFDDCDVVETTAAVLSKISSTTSAPKAVAVAKQPKFEWNDDFKKVLLLEGIKDAGNLGTIIRTASAFGVDSLILFGDTVDLYNPKCVRSAVGNLWKIPVFAINDIEFINDKFKDFQRIATLPKSDDTIFLKAYKPKDKCLVMFGSEANGLSDSLKNIATDNVTIEMSNSVESLNLSISVGVLLYHIM